MPSSTPPPCWPGRYLSNTPVIMTQMAHPVLFIGKPTRYQVLAVSSLRQETEPNGKRQQRRHRPERAKSSSSSRRTLASSKSTPTLTDFYFAESASRGAIHERLEGIRHSELQLVALDHTQDVQEAAADEALDSPLCRKVHRDNQQQPETRLHKVDESGDEEAYTEEATVGSEDPKSSGEHGVGRPLFAGIGPRYREALDELRQAASLMADATAEIRNDNAQLARIVELIWRSYEACAERLVEEVLRDSALDGTRVDEAAGLRAQLETAHGSLRAAQAALAEKEGIVEFYRERYERLRDASKALTS
ncbi:Uncharacterized protein PBTT_04429 [Plasmodiophora brassicae]